MKNGFILLILLFTISAKTISKSSIIEFDVEQQLDENNNQFTFTNDEPEKIFYLVEIHSKIILKYAYECQDSRRYSSDTYIEHYFFLEAKTGECSLNISTYNSDIQNLEGTLLVHPLDHPLKIDLETKTYKLESSPFFNYIIPDITYLVSNLTKDITAEFSYERPTIILNNITYYPKNPFEICHENDCQDNIKYYTFYKGKDYIIKVKFEIFVIDYFEKEYFLTGFSFGKKPDGSSEANNILINKITILILLLFLF